MWNKRAFSPTPPHPLSSTPVPMVVPTQRHKSRCPSEALYGSTETFIISYIVLSSQKEFWWMVAKTTLEAPRCLATVAYLSSHDCPTSACCYRRLLRDHHYQQPCEYKSAEQGNMLKLKSNISRAAHRRSIRNIFVRPLSTKFAQVSVSYQVCLSALHLFISVNWTLKHPSPHVYVLCTRGTKRSAMKTPCGSTYFLRKTPKRIWLCVERFCSHTSKETLRMIHTSALWLYTDIKIHFIGLPNNGLSPQIMTWHRIQLTLRPKSAMCTIQSMMGPRWHS